MSNALSAQGATFLRVLEGFVDHWYADAVGVGTIGIGFTWASGGFREWWDRTRPGQKFGPGAKMTREETDKCLHMSGRVRQGGWRLPRQDGHAVGVRRDDLTGIQPRSGLAHVEVGRLDQGR